MADAAQATEVIRFLGESIGFWIQTTAISLSAFGAVGVIYHNGKVARRRASIDHIIHQKTDKTLLEAIQMVYKLHDSKTPFSQFCLDKEAPEREAILQVLNNHEFIALGIRRGAFEERIFKELQCSNFLKVWDASSGMIQELRQIAGNRKTLFQEFEWLAKRWEKKPLKRHE